MLRHSRSEIRRRLCKCRHEQRPWARSPDGSLGACHRSYAPSHAPRRRAAASPCHAAPCRLCPCCRPCPWCLSLRRPCGCLSAAADSNAHTASVHDHPPSVLKQGQGPWGTETHWVRVSLTCFGSTGGQRVVLYRPRGALPEKPNQIASKPQCPTDLWLSITGPAPGFACPNSAMAAEYSSRHTKAPNTAHRPYGCVRPLPETFSPALYTFHAVEVPPSL